MRAHRTQHTAQITQAHRHTARKHYTQIRHAETVPVRSAAQTSCPSPVHSAIGRRVRVRAARRRPAWRCIKQQHVDINSPMLHQGSCDGVTCKRIQTYFRGLHAHTCVVMSASLLASSTTSRSGIACRSDTANVKQVKKSRMRMQPQIMKQC